MDKCALEAHDYVFDIFPVAEGAQRAEVQTQGKQSA
jgi:hypothetical protein